VPYKFDGVVMLPQPYAERFHPLPEGTKGLGDWNDNAVAAGYKPPFQSSAFPILIFHAPVENEPKPQDALPEYLVRYVLPDSCFEDIFCETFAEYVAFLRHLEPIAVAQAAPAVALALAEFMRWSKSRAVGPERILVP
jgi:hypothetical protein